MSSILFLFLAGLACVWAIVDYSVTIDDDTSCMTMEGVLGELEDDDPQTCQDLYNTYWLMNWNVVITEANSRVDIDITGDVSCGEELSVFNRNVSGHIQSCDYRIDCPTDTGYRCVYQCSACTASTPCDGVEIQVREKEVPNDQQVRMMCGLTTHSPIVSGNYWDEVC